jgi:tRNA pseudouridine13 synthase
VAVTELTVLPLLTRDVPGLPGVVRRSPEDFRVDELRLYEPSGEGDHVHFEVEKRGLTTDDLVRRVARALGVRPASVGYAGRKDARAVTRQTLSVEHVDEDEVRGLELDGACVLSAARHGNKLRRGHLLGNRFRIVVRESDPTRAPEVRRTLARFAETGLPNAFGPQRFGNRGDTAAVGAAIVRGDAASAVRAIAGAPGPRDHGAVRRARELFDAGEYAAAARAWPPGYGTSARLCRAMARSNRDARPDRALRSLSRRDVAFYVSAWQAELFNLVLAARLDGLDRIEDGEVLWDHALRRAVPCADLEAARARARDFEVSPTGPLVGPRMARPRGAAARLEDEVLASRGVETASLGPRWRGIDGGRRPLRVPVTEATVDGLADDPAALVLGFVLPAGAYATSVLAELGKDRLVVAQ